MEIVFTHSFFNNHPDNSDNKRTGRVSHHIHQVKTASHTHGILDKLNRDTEKTHTKESECRKKRRDAPPEITTKTVDEDNKCEESEHQRVNDLVGTGKQLDMHLSQRTGRKRQP